MKKAGYLLETTKGIIHAEYIIFAMGEFSFPNKSSIKGAYKNSLHYGELILGLKLKGISRQLSEEMRVRLMQLLN